MGLLMNLFEGVFGGCPAAKPPSVIERLCKEVGWNVEERNGATISLHFKDPIIGVRKLMIASRENAAVLQVTTTVCMRGQQSEILGHLMGRNADSLIGAWHLKDQGGGKITYTLQHCVFARGLDATEFAVICENMIKESHAFDANLRSVGLI